MNSAFTHHIAERTAGRLARRAALACALMLGAVSAFAQQHGDRRDDPNMQAMQGQPQGQGYQRPERFHLPQQDGRQFDGRNGDDARRLQQEQAEAQREARRGSRMTPDERRDLRRQINEAGMDLYPQRRRDR